MLISLQQPVRRSWRAALRGVGGLGNAVDVWGFVGASDDLCPLTHVMRNGRCLTVEDLQLDADQAAQQLASHPVYVNAGPNAAPGTRVAEVRGASKAFAPVLTTPPPVVTPPPDAPAPSVFAPLPALPPNAIAPIDFPAPYPTSALPFPNPPTIGGVSGWWWLAGAAALVWAGLKTE